MKGTPTSAKAPKKGTTGKDAQCNDILDTLDEIYSDGSQDLIMGPYRDWVDLPKGINVKPFDNEKAIPTHLFGPQNDKANKLETHDGVAAGATISTYPGGQGEPICDHFEMELYTRRWILAVADGCSWGYGPREAAIRASTACLASLRDNQKDIREVQEAGRLILRGFAKAHQRIVEGYDDMLQVGTTTLISGIMLELDVDDGVQRQLKDMEKRLFEQSEKFHVFDLANIDPATRVGSILLRHEAPMQGMTPLVLQKDNSEAEDGMKAELKIPKPALSRPSEEPYKYLFVCASVGDCKCFHYSSETGHVTDITHGNRTQINDPKDPGGRLGPQIEGDPDLRNLALYIVPCHESDVFFAVTDGIHDNLDPQNLGVTPKDLGGPYDDWDVAEKNDLPWADGMKTQFRCQYLKRLVEQVCTDTSVLPYLATEKLCSHVSRLTQYSRDFMVQNPNLRLPEDYEAYPGKMDHVTCVSVVAAGRLLPRSYQQTNENKPVARTEVEWDPKDARQSMYTVMPATALFETPLQAAKMRVPVYSLDKTLLSDVSIAPSDLLTDVICQVKHKLERYIEGRPFRLRKGDASWEKKALPILKKDFGRRGVDYFGEKDVIVMELAAGGGTAYTTPTIGDGNGA